MRLIFSFVTLIAVLTATLLPAAVSQADDAQVPAAAPAAIPGQPDDPWFFPQTGFRVEWDSFRDYFQRRGGVRTFGYPVSRDFPFLGCASQFFQREVMQQCAGQGVTTLNLLDGDLLPYTQINGSTFPAADPTVIGQAPSTGQADYGRQAIDFVRTVAPEVVADPPPGPAGPVGAEAGAGAAVPIEAATGVAGGGASSGRPAPGVPAGVKASR